MNKLFHHKDAGLIASLSAFFVLFLAMFDYMMAFWLTIAFLGLYLAYWLMSQRQEKTVLKKTKSRTTKKTSRRKK